MEATLGQPVHVTTGWNYLRHLTYTVQQPRPRHPQAANAEQQQEYKKNPGARRRAEARLSRAFACSTVKET
ncbi:winged helix-turn-helix domain-containing protein [Deinococcus altitudinis]|uniref:winged helix-turn-helix domain-containing protein n=1 Tax=Deinococcus altitudinis TaxID=468914 RepID=UPI0038911A8C